MSEILHDAANRRFTLDADGAGSVPPVVLQSTVRPYNLTTGTT